MKLPHSTFFIVSICSLANPSSATILIKFPKAYQHYMKYKAVGHSDGFDPLDDLDQRGRQLLCNAMIKAKQFIIQYYPSEYARRKRRPRILNSRAFTPSSTRNYQTIMQYFLSEQELRFENRVLRQGSVHERVKTILCAESPITKWFITSGFVDKTFYSLELTFVNRKQPTFLMTGIFEPRAIVQNRTPEYFKSQLRTSVDSMESVCKLQLSDILRLCSAVFDALTASEKSLRDEMKRTNKFRAERAWCRLKGIRVHGNGIESMERAKALQCRALGAEKEITLFHVLADFREHGAAFVLFETEITNVLELRARVTKIGALLNPLGSQQVPLVAADTDEDSASSEDASMDLLHVFSEEDTMDANAEPGESPKLMDLTRIYNLSPRLSSSELSIRPRTRPFE